MKERIQKLLGNAGVASRRQVEAMVLDGRISVNGHVVRELPVLVDPAKDRVSVDGENIRLRPTETGRRLYIIMNKPAGVVCTNVAQGAQRRAVDLLPSEFKARLYPVGRLDADSRGLLLLTNDGDLTNRLTHPRYGVTKTDRVTVEGAMSPETLEQFRAGGIWLVDTKTGKGHKTGPTQAKIVSRSPASTVLEIAVQEGRNRQVRRVLAKLGHKVRELVRVRFGPLVLENLPSGKFRELTPREVKLLQRAARETKPGKSDDAPGIEDEPAME
ncbi:MAG: pseudouridine synthase [Tepidisphaerales bacterium]